MYKSYGFIFEFTRLVLPTITIGIAFYTVNRIYKSAKSFFAYFLMLCCLIWALVNIMFTVNLSIVRPIIADGTIIRYEPNITAFYVLSQFYMSNSVI